MKSRVQVLERIALWDRLSGDSEADVVTVLHAQLNWLVTTDREYSVFTDHQDRFTARLMLRALAEAVRLDAYRGPYSLDEIRTFVGRAVQAFQNVVSPPV